MKKIHLGCGSVYKDGWINIDLDSPVADMQRDLTESLPFANESVGLIYTEHFIEHISRSQAVSFLRECHRILDSSGVMRISTPNLRFLVECYSKGKITEWGQLWAPDSACNLMNEGMRSWGHTYLYDCNEMVRIVTEAGFPPPRLVRWGDSEHTDLKNLETRPHHQDLIVEICKTAPPRKKEKAWLKRMLGKN